MIFGIHEPEVNKKLNEAANIIHNANLRGNCK